MDVKINIPNFPNICRICFAKISESEPVSSITDQLQNGASYWAMLSDLFSLDHEQEPAENNDSENLPRYICNNCAKYIDFIQAFRLETIANQKFLHAWVAFKYRADVGPLTDLFHIQTGYHGIIRKTLQKLEVIGDGDVCLADLIKDSEKISQDVDVKLELQAEPVEIDDPLLNAFFTEQGNEVKQYDDYEHQICDEAVGCAEDILLDSHQSHDNAVGTESRKTKKPKGVRYQDIDGVQVRLCPFENCGVVPRGQGEKHNRERHRAYCKICGMVFLDHAQAMHHVAIHQSEEDRLRCEVCDKPFWRDLDLKLHRRDFHGIDVDRYECSYCEQRFKRQTDMQQHREIHTVCKFCPKNSKSYKTMLVHTREQHRDKLNPCQSCPATFLGTKELEMHEKIHIDGRHCVQFSLNNWVPAHCQTCVRDLFNVEYLQSHIEQVHTQGLAEKALRNRNFAKRTKEELAMLEYKFKCSDCSARFRLKASLRGHWRKNHGGEKFICEHCGACFKSKGEMQLHGRYLHTKITPFECDFCDKRCHTKNDLKIHRRSHTNEKPYKCWYDGCDKAYKTRSAVTKHYRVHSDEKRYKCLYEGCDKAYKCSQLLKVHHRKHTLEKPFKCWYCELYFDSNNNRSKHSQRHHVGLPIGRELERLNQQKMKEVGSSESPKSSTGAGNTEEHVAVRKAETEDP